MPTFPGVLFNDRPVLVDGDVCFLSFIENCITNVRIIVGVFSAPSKCDT